MTDISGAVHCHRIYVAWRGTGKAQIPPLPNGKPRKVKKLAWVPDGFKSAGLSVVWGNISACTWAISRRA
jgi:hypothetical protein